MNIRFDGKRALVTGAGRGIGRGIAKQLLECGAETFALSRTQSDLDSLKQEHPNVQTVCVDLADWDSTRKAVEGIGPIDLLVNNAAINCMAPFLEFTKEDIETCSAINLKAVFNVSQVVARSMVEKGQGGSIVNISSISSTMAIYNTSVGSAMKAGVDQLTRTMALELGPHQIRVNAVNPGVVKTEMFTRAKEEGKVSSSYIEEVKSRTPQKKFAEIQDVARAVMYLLSDKADMINGVTLKVDGGFSIS